MATPSNDYISAEGKDVIIIGGGDTGTDCVGTSLRHGCKSVAQLEIMGKPPLTRAANNPWPEWPKTYKMDYGQEEAAAKFGDDPRVYLTTATHFEGDAESGNVKGRPRRRCRVEERRQRQFRPSKGRWHRKSPCPAQLVLLAMGFLGPEQPLIEALGARNRSLAATSKPSTTNTPPVIPGIFAAGDCRRGQSPSSSGPSTKAEAPPASATAS